MKKTSIFIILFTIFLAISCRSVYASSSATYFDGKSPIIDDPMNAIQILSNEITINTDTSKINTEFILKNTSNEEIITTITLPLENAELSLSINNLAIVVNGVNVGYTRNESGEYIFRTKIPAGTGKKVEFSYYTDNNLREAKVVKYNFDNFKGKRIGKLKVDIILNEKDVPLVKAIYPGHYTYDQNVITVEYYDMDINVITKDVIVTKETYKNLKYGREYELTEYDKKILEKIDDLFVGDFFEEYPNEKIENAINKFINYGKEFEDTSDFSEPFRQIKTYIQYKEAIKKSEYSLLRFPNEDWILIYETARKYGVEAGIDKEAVWCEIYNIEDIKNLKDKKICVEFVETVENKELYTEKCRREPVLISVSEIQTLKTLPSYQFDRVLFEKIIFLDEGIDGEKIGATEEEKISYLNSINADLYIRVELYEGKVISFKEYNENNQFKSDEGDGRVGYYRDTDKELATAFAYNKNIATGFVYVNPYEIGEKAYVKLTNEYIEKNCEVPTLVQFVGFVKEQDGKNVVSFFDDTGFYNGPSRGISTAYNAIQTEEAQRQLKKNKANNEAKRVQALKDLKAVTYVENEQQIQQELLEQKKLEEQQAQINNNVNNNNVNNSVTSENKSSEINFEIKDIIIFSAIGLAIVICIIILVFEKRKV